MLEGCFLDVGLFDFAGPLPTRETTAAKGKTLPSNAKRISKKEEAVVQNFCGVRILNPLT
jgi:hypothetical protein